MKFLFLLLMPVLCLTTLHQWELAKDKNGIKVYTRKKDGYTFKEFKATTTFKTTKDKMEAEFLNIKGMSLWYDMIEKVELIKKISNNEAIYKLYFDFPSPTTDRYAVVKASLTKDVKTGDILVNSKYHAIKHNPEPDRIQVTNIESKWVIKGSDFALNIEHSGHLDPAGNIPLWMFNSGLSDGPYRTIMNLKKRVE
jgi:hypothetical protein